jgi:hypothetical protein
MPGAHASAGPSRAPTRWQDILFFIGKVAAGIGILVWLYKHKYLDPELLLKLTWSFRTVNLLMTAFALVGIALVLLAWRLHLLLDQQGVCISGQKALSLTLIGALFGALLPGLIGGDVVKAVYLCGSASHQRSKAVSVVIIDRIIGLYSLLLLGAIASLVAQLSGFYAAPTQVMTTVSGIAVLATICLSILFASARTKRIVRLTEKLPPRLLNIVRALTESCDRPVVILTAICLSLVSHGMVVLSFYVMAVLLRDTLPFATHFVVDPLAMVMNVVPLTPGGIGVTEGTFAYLYNRCGSPQGAAVGLMGRFVQYLVFTVGGVTALIFTRIHVRELISSSQTERSK